MEDWAKQEKKEQMQTSVDKARINTENDAKIEQIVTQIVQQRMSDMVVNIQEARLEIQRMKEEGKIEASNSKITNVSTAGGGNIQAGSKPANTP
jgi:hypothetical protein